jgi:hypothetical protein
MGELEYRKYVPRGEDKEVTVAEIRASRIVSLVKREAAGTPSPNDGSEDDPSSLPF